MSRPYAVRRTSARLLVATAVLLSAPPAPVLTAAPADAGGGRSLKPCAYEDGPGPCVWDARHRGNGVGKSFVVRRDGRVVYVTHRRAHRLSR